MHRPILKRATVVVAGLALGTTGVLALAPAAGAAPAEVAATLAPAKQPIILNSSNQTAGDLTVTLTAAANKLDTIDVTIAPKGSNCNTAEGAAAAVSWAAVPTIAVPSVATANVTGALVDECAGGTVNTTLRLTVDGPDAGLPNGTAIELTGIKYNGTATTPEGDVRVHVNDLGVDNADSNATVAPVDRLQGATRYDTAAAIAAAQFDDQCNDDAIVVSGTNFPDALASSFLSKPILLTDPGSLSAPTKAALQSMGVKNVQLIGGTDAVSSAVFTAIDNQAATNCGGAAAAGTINTTRVAGANRYDTARAIAVTGSAGTFDSNVSGTCDDEKTVIVVSGQNYPDALAAGALASNSSRACGAGNIPLLLTESASLRPETVEAIGQLDPTNVIIVGGTQAVAPSVETALEALSGVATVNRIDGPTRQDTAIELANVLTDTTIGGFKDRFIVASGVNFPDALVAGPFAGQVGAPILLSVSATSLGTNSANTIKAADGTPPPNITHATLLGGTVALSDAVGADTGAAFLARN